MKKELMTVVEQNEIAENIYKLKLSGQLVQAMNNPGQFVHLKVSEGAIPLLRRPISICQIDQQNDTFTMIYRAEGQGTKLLSEKKPGDKVDVLGPLGSGFPIEEANKNTTALLVGGGIGVPPLFELSKRLVEKQVNVIHVLGFQTKSAVFYEEEFSKLGKTYVATVDGTYGHSGFVTDVIDVHQLSFDIVYGCGPTPMLKALDARYQGKRGYLSFEERMGCGIGACFACVCHLQADPNGNSYKKVCSDGPVFPLGVIAL